MLFTAFLNQTAVPGMSNTTRLSETKKGSFVASLFKFVRIP